MALVRDFLDATVTSPAADLVSSRFADPIIVGDPSGTRPVPAAVLSNAMTARGQLASPTHPIVTILDEWDAIALGPVMVLASARWTLTSGDRGASLVSDYLLDVSSGAARCLSYTTRQNMMEELAASGLLPAQGRADAPPSRSS